MRTTILTGALFALMVGCVACAPESNKNAQLPVTSSTSPTPDTGAVDTASTTQLATAKATENPLRGFFALRPDPHPPKLAADVHFPTSNERFLYLWRDAVDSLGGVFIGVGTDQNFILAGWSKPEMVVLMDFDQMVVDVNNIYRLMFQNAADPETFIKLWSKKSLKEVEGFFRRAYPEKDVFDPLWKLYKQVRRPIEIRLAVMNQDFKEKKQPIFLNDAEQYNHLARLFRRNRVVTLRGDLTASQALRSIASAATTANIPVRVLYLSNAERYFSYGEEFKQNIAALPFDERSVVLRTTGLGTWAKGDPFWYVVQGGLNFQHYLKNPKITQVAQLLSWRKATQKRYLYSIDSLPPELPPPPTKPETAATLENAEASPGMPSSRLDDDSPGKMAPPHNDSEPVEGNNP